MYEKAVKGIIYCQFHEADGPSIISVMPPDMSVVNKNLVSLKAITLLSGEKWQIPKSLVVIPYPSEKLKSVVKYLQIKDEERRGGFKLTMITMLFEEDLDAIFYKYMNNFENLFNEAATKIVELEESKAEKILIDEELESLRQKALDFLNELYQEEKESAKAEEFPEPVDEVAEAQKYNYKLLVCGDPEVGKTASVLRFTDEAFKRTYLPTIGVNVTDKRIRLKESNILITFAIWDIAGQSKFQPMRKHFYAGAQGVFFMFDLTNSESFQNVKKWYQDIKSNLQDEFIGVLIGNKRDLAEQRNVEQQAISMLSEELGLEYIETSALSGQNINEAFDNIGEKLVGFKKRKTFFIL